jgi:chromosomal replication initiator protein
VSARTTSGPSDAGATWTAVTELVRRRVGETNFAAWIAPLRCTGTADSLTLVAPDRTTREWVGRHFLTVIEQALREVVGGACPVRLGVDVPAPLLPIPVVAPSPEHVFETFVVGESNAEAYQAARQLVEGPPGGALFVHGPTGVGKTHLLHAAFHALDRRGTRVACLPAAGLVEVLVAAYGGHGHAAFWQDLRPLGALLLDDVHSLASQEEVQEQLVEGLVDWVEGGRLLALTSDRAPDELPEFAARIRERFARGVVAAIRPPEPALRLAILQRKASARGIVLEPQLATRMAGRITGNVRRLEGALTRLAAQALLTGRPLDEALAEQVLPELRDVPVPPLTPERILEATAAVFGLPVRTILGRRRRPELVLPRQIAMYLARKLLRRPYAELGRAFGREHTTVLNAWRAIGARLETDGALAARVEQIEQRLSTDPR